MLIEKDTAIIGECQYYSVSSIETDASGRNRTVRLEPRRRREEFRCPYCGSDGIHQNSTYILHLKDMPPYPGSRSVLEVPVRRFECQGCLHAFSEECDLTYPGTRITSRLAGWIKALLSAATVKAVSGWTGVCWETVKRIHMDHISAALEERQAYLRDSGYRPRFLAVDEFAVQKGHRYATCVMDLDTGEILWVGRGRSIADFARFFEDMDMDMLSGVKAVAMDMNASYCTLVERFLPSASIVYDRYHMESQYGKEVMGCVRLDEAREMKERASEALREDRDLSKRCRREYSRLKGARWMLLGHMDEDNEDLMSILSDYSDLAVCFAMKERMSELFRITDHAEALRGWEEWFDAAEGSGISHLERFARLKRKRIDGLASHALYPVSTGRLEGRNNRIKVVKRIAYGFRDDAYFFSLIRFLSIPLSHTIPR